MHEWRNIKLHYIIFVICVTFSRFQIYCLHYYYLRKCARCVRFGHYYSRLKELQQCGRQSSKPQRRTFYELCNQFSFRIYCNQSTYLQQQIYKQAMRIVSVFVMLMIFVTGYANICGGNCPAGNCPTCPCGYTTVRIDLDTFCTNYSWNQNCCKCISQRISAGSQNFFKYESSLFYGGIMGLGQNEAINLCGFHPWSLVCYSYKDNAHCANRIYLRDGSWKYWKNDALACGCSIQSASESGLNNLSEITE